MAEEAGFAESIFNGMSSVIESEAAAFGGLVDTIVKFDVVASCGDALDIFTAAGSALITLFFCMEIFSYASAIDFNNTGIEGAMKIAMKLIVAQVIVSQVGNVVNLVSGLFKSAALTSYGEVFSGISESFAAAATTGEMDGGILGMNYICMAILLFFVAAVLFVLFGMIITTVLGVVFETGILTAISPVALSTLVNSQTRQTGIAFIKNFAAVSMQWGVLSICFIIFKNISTGLTISFADGGGFLAHIMRFATPLLSVVMLAVSISKASDITKRALGG